ncbi:NACHT domain-containing protein [Tolypothrix campylonemoides VB511288]|nr:NACHT domain-containing protein [Tolypothrix campylonemoides VB511288]
MVDWSGYLNSVCQAYAQWWQVYTFTDVLGRNKAEPRSHIPLLDLGLHIPLLDLGLIVQTVERDQQGEKQEKIERFSVLEGLRKYAPDHVLLVGRPGSGKSTALARLLLEEANVETRHGASLESASPIPVLVELRYYQKSVLELIQNFFKRHKLFLEITEIEKLLFHGQLLLLVDGVNELPSEEARRDLKAFRQNHPQTQMIFTTRDLGVGGDLDIAKKLEMQPLTEEQMQQFVRAYLPKQGEEMLRQLGDRLWEFGKTPLLLWMLCSVFVQNQNTVPSNLGSVFRLFTQTYDQKLKQDIPTTGDFRRWCHKLLQHLAWVMTQGEALTDLQVAIPRQQAEAVLTEFLQGKVPHPENCALAWLQDLLNHHLIQLSADNKIEFLSADNKIEFRHQLIQEYYTAECLLTRLSNLSDDSLKREYLNYLKWTEPLALMVELLDNEAQAVRVVKLALEVDWQLGARLAGAVKQEWQEKTVDLIADLKLPQLLKVKLFEISKSEKAIPFLEKATEHKDSDVRSRAVSVLGQIKSETAVSQLIKLLEDEDSYVRSSAASALEKIKSETAVTQLIKLLEDQKSNMRSSAADALVQIKSEAAPQLIKLLEDEDFYVRYRAADILGKIGEPSILPDIKKFLLKGKHLNLLNTISSIQERARYYDPTLIQSAATINAPENKNNFMEQKRTLRVVVASPNDVKPERDILPNIIDELNRAIAADKHLRLELSRWETDTYPGFHPEGPQGLIDPILNIANCDILIGIFWKRFGTPTKDGQTGTEHEFQCAYESWKKPGSPQIMFYFCKKAYTPQSVEETHQWGKVLEFKKQFPKEGLSWNYKNKSEFEKLVRNHLTQLIRQNWGIRPE